MNCWHGGCDILLGPASLLCEWLIGGSISISCIPIFCRNPRGSGGSVKEWLLPVISGIRGSG